MVFTILSSLFLLLLAGVAFYGYGFMMKSSRESGENDLQRCLLCRASYPKSKLVERQIGDSRIVYFCMLCVQKLSEDANLL